MKLLFENWRQYRNKLLLEDSRGSIKRIVGLPGWIADYLHEKSPKYSFTLAKLWLDVAVKGLSLGVGVGSIAAKEIKAYIKNSVSPDVRRGSGEDMLRMLDKFFDERYRPAGPATARAMSDLMGGLGHYVLEFLNKYPQLEKELKDSSRAWELIFEKEKEEKLAKETTREALMTFPDGFYWTDLGVDCSKYEEEEMQHCGVDLRGNLVSLRDKNHKPHVTMTVDLTGEREATTDTTDYRGGDLWDAPDPDRPGWMVPDVYQIKGKQNVAPDKKYWSYIVDFFEKYKPKMHDDEIKMKSKELYRQLVPSTIKEGDLVRMLPLKTIFSQRKFQDADDAEDKWDKFGGKVLQVIKITQRTAFEWAVLIGAGIEHLPPSERLILTDWLKKADTEQNLQENKIRIKVKIRQ